MGVEKVMVLPVTATTSLISFRGRPDRLNQVSESGNGSSPHCTGGLWRWKTIRSEAQIDDTDAGLMRAGRGVHVAAW